MKDAIPEQDWQNWVETGEASDRLLMQIALKIKMCHLLGEREASIYVFHAKEIEDLLKTI
jgi:hypothetical protein